MPRPAALLAALALALAPVAAPPAAATTLAERDVVGTAVDGVLEDGVFVSPTFRVDVDEAAVRDAAARTEVPLHVVLLGQSVAPEQALPSLVQQIGAGTGDPSAAVLVITDQPLAWAGNGSAAASRGVDAGAALDAALVGTTDGVIDGPTVVRLVGEVAEGIEAQRTGAGRSGGSGGGSGAAGWLLGAGLLGGAGWLVVRGRRDSRARAQRMQDARADVESLHARLGNDVATLAPGDDRVAAQALADAAERYSATGALMARADTDGEWAAARRTALEGLTAARVVRERLGLDPGPAIPLETAPEAPRLDAPARVQVGEEVHEASPEYVPGRPHWYEGGYYGGRPVPSGWYAVPFWQTMLLGGVLGGGYRRSGSIVLGGGGMRSGPVRRRTTR